MRYVRDNIDRLAAYTPGEQPVRTDVVKLNTNENPYPPTQAVMRAIAAVSPDQLRRYPSPQATTFRKAAAEVHDVQPTQIIATNGGDELLRMVMTAFCQPHPQGGRGVGVASPSYSLYPVLAEIHETSVTVVPLNDDFSIPADFATRLNDTACGLAMLVNPHAPSGRFQPIDQLAEIARSFNGVLLIDEAYVDFAQSDALSLVRGESAMKNVVILRTLSKGYSLAGLRFGYGVAHASLIEALDKIRDSYNTDAVSQAAAVAALQSRADASQSWKKVIDERQRMTHELKALGFAVLPSASNFVLASPTPGGLAAADIYRSLKDRGIFVRYFDQDRLRDKLRITIGTPQQNDALLAGIKSLETSSV